MLTSSVVSWSVLNTRAYLKKGRRKQVFVHLVPAVEAALSSGPKLGAEWKRKRSHLVKNTRRSVALPLWSCPRSRGPL